MEKVGLFDPSTLTLDTCHVSALPHIFAAIQLNSRKERRLLIKALYERYQRAARTDRSAILTLLTERFGYHRKHATRLMSAKRKSTANTLGDQRTPSPHCLEAIDTIRSLTSDLGARRLQTVFSDWVDSFQLERNKLTEKELARLKTASPATLCRFSARISSNKGNHKAVPHAERISSFITKNYRASTVHVPGEILLRDVRIHKQGETTNSRALVSIDQVSGWYAAAEVAADPIATLNQLFARLPFQVWSISLESNDPTLKQAIRDWCWNRAEPVGFCSFESNTQEDVPAPFISREAETYINFGYPVRRNNGSYSSPFRFVLSSSNSQEERSRLLSAAGTLYRDACVFTQKLLDYSPEKSI